MLKKIIIILSLALFMAAAGLYYVFVYSVNHHRDINKEASVIVSSEELTKAFEQDESIANSKFLNKVVTINGVLLELGQDQVGKTTLLIGKPDAFTNVFVTLKGQDKQVKIGDSLTIKGVCNGHLSDVVISDARVIK